jgi:hypothetical protein
MKHAHKRISISGTATAVFSRRSVAESKDGKHGFRPDIGQTFIPS